MKVGVFDSGMGGLSVANAIERDMPNVEVIFVNDQQNVPYGDKTADELYSLVLPILQELATRTDVIVIACNTVTTTIIGRLRQVLTVPLVGIEPMVKPAAGMTKSGIIAVCATPTTLASERYNELKHTYATDIQVIEPDCSNWARMIEDNSINQQAIEQQISSAIKSGADTIVLACTHYHWIEEDILKFAKGKAAVLLPEQATIKQLATVLSQLP